MDYKPWSYWVDLVIAQISDKEFTRKVWRGEVQGAVLDPIELYCMLFDDLTIREHAQIYRRELGEKRSGLLMRIADKLEEIWPVGARELESEDVLLLDPRWDELVVLAREYYSSGKQAR